MGHLFYRIKMGGGPNVCWSRNLLVKSKTDVFLGKWILDREELWIIAGQESEMMDVDI